MQTVLMVRFTVLRVRKLPVSRLGDITAGGHIRPATHRDYILLLGGVDLVFCSFFGTELHKAIFIPLLDHKAPAEAKTYALTLVDARFGILERHLAGREFVLDAFSIADAYLCTVLNWTRAVPIDLSKWPAVKDYHSRMRKRPSIARAWNEELAMYAEEEAKNKAA